MRKRNVQTVLIRILAGSFLLAGLGLPAYAAEVPEDEITIQTEQQPEEESTEAVTEEDTDPEEQISELDTDILDTVTLTSTVTIPSGSEPVTVDVLAYGESAGESVTEYYYVPGKTGYYRIRSQADTSPEDGMVYPPKCDPEILIVDVAENGILYNAYVDDGDDKNFNVVIRLTAGRTYSFRFSDLQLEGETVGGYPVTITPGIKLEAPRISAVENTTEGVRITASSGKDPTADIMNIDSYAVLRKPYASAEEWSVEKHRIGIMSIGAESYVDTEVVSGSRYLYTLAALDTNEKVISEIDESGKGILYLTAIRSADVKAENVEAVIRLSWSKVTGADGYLIYRKVSGGSYKKLAAVSKNTLTYTDTSALTIDQKYVYAIRACRTVDGTEMRGSYTGRSIAYTALEVPTLSNTSAGVKLTWSKAAGAAGYYIYRRVPGGKYSVIQKVSGAATRTWVDAAVKSNNGVRYEYAVRAYMRSGGGIVKGAYAGSSIDRLTGASIAALANPSTGTLKVSWRSVSSVSGYQIKYSYDEKFTDSTTVTVKGAGNTYKSLTSLKKGKTYYVRLRTYRNKDGLKSYSAWSGTRSLKLTR